MSGDRGPALPLGADLHVHSCLSDGSETPADLLRQAAGRLALISICDHDTIAAYDSAEVWLGNGPTTLPGIEMSVRFGCEELHLLGYFPDGFPESFRRFVANLEDDRRRRVEVGVQRLRRRGVPLRWDRFQRWVRGGVPCRSHVAWALMEMGYGRNPRRVCDRYLNGGIIDPPGICAEEGLAAIRQHGGVAVWAHPPLRRVGELARSLRAAGLQGLEVYRPGTTPARRRTLLEIAGVHGLFATGGSDFHRASRRAELGGFHVPLESLPGCLRSFASETSGPSTLH